VIGIRRRLAIVLALLCLAPRLEAAAAKSKSEEGSKLVADTFSGLSFRGIGPAMISGRITDVAVDPRNPSIRYVTAASGGVWKTTNAGTTWKPVFDAQG
jgi:hypothetical protein